SRVSVSTASTTEVFFLSDLLTSIRPSIMSSAFGVCGTLSVHQSGGLVSVCGPMGLGLILDHTNWDRLPSWKSWAPILSCACPFANTPRQASGGLPVESLLNGTSRGYRPHSSIATSDLLSGMVTSQVWCRKWTRM